jgi:hypothetical protein
LVPSLGRQAAFSAGVTCFLAAPFVSGALYVRRFAAPAGNLTLLGPVHRRKTAILFTHMSSPADDFTSLLH